MTARDRAARWIAPALLTLIAALLCQAWLADLHLGTWPLTASDFQQYCACVEGVRAGKWGMCPAGRSPVAALPAGWLAGRLGIVDGLAAASTLSLWIALLAAWGWAGALSGARGAALAAVWALAIPSWVVLGRTVSLYPELFAACMLAGAGAQAAIRYRTSLAVAAGSAGAGLALLVDVRGLWWGLAGAAVSLIAAVVGAAEAGEEAGSGEGAAGRAGRARAWIGRGAAWIGPLAASWLVGAWLIPPKSTTLEEQALRYAQDMARSHGIALEGVLLQQKVQGGFLWGHSGPGDLYGALRLLTDIRRALPPDLGAGEEAAWRWAGWVQPWLPAAAAAGAAIGWHLRRRPLQLVGLLGALLPSALALWGAREGTLHPRFVGIGIAPLPVLLGAGAAVALRGRGPGWLWPGVLLALVAGPGPLGPRAGWRLPIWADNEPQQTLRAFPKPPEGAETSCMDGLRRDAQQGRGPGSRWFIMPAQEIEPGQHVPEPERNLR